MTTVLSKHEGAQQRERFLGSVDFLTSKKQQESFRFQVLPGRVIVTSLTQALTIASIFSSDFLEGCFTPRGGNIWLVQCGLFSYWESQRMCCPLHLQHISARRVHLAPRPRAADSHLNRTRLFPPADVNSNFYRFQEKTMYETRLVFHTSTSKISPGPGSK